MAGMLGLQLTRTDEKSVGVQREIRACRIKETKGEIGDLWKLSKERVWLL